MSIVFPSSLVFFAFALCASSSSAQSASRAQVETYLKSVYAKSNFSPLSDSAVFSFFDNLTYYYQGRPTPASWTAKWPSGRTQSHPYAGTQCDCLHIDLQMCLNRSVVSNCPFWPVETYLNLDWVLNKAQFLPSNVWYEGVTFPGEWAFPVSCINSTLEYAVYAWHQHMWLYATTGTGVWFNTGTTAPAYNKVHWLLKYGVGSSLGSNTTQVMDSIANLACPNYQQQSSCTYCMNPLDPTQCCCHGHYSQNLGIQVVNYKTQKGVSWQAALDAVANMYATGMTGMQHPNSAWPSGTFFGYVDLLDSAIFQIQSQKQFDSLQFLREPQHGGYHADPVYAFEVLQHTPFNGHGYWHWHDLCSSSIIGVVDPLDDLANYQTHGYVKTSTVAPITAWSPRPSFAALFNLKTVSASQNADTSANAATARADDNHARRSGINVVDGAASTDPTTRFDALYSKLRF